jgi:LuxR family maltose regulon positive regulatory protein
VVREALVERLRRTSAPLILVDAPAGYGKTTLLTQWVERDGRPFAWLQLAAIHDDPVAFLTYLATTLSGVADVDARILSTLRTSKPPIEESVLPALGEALERAEAFLLVLDDAHLVGNATCWRYVDLLLGQLPDGARLALASRGVPPLPLPRLRAAGSLTELRLDDLRLTAHDVRAVLDLHGREATAAELDDLVRCTEGWATGIYLVLLAGEGRPTEDLLTRVHGDRREIAGYLTEEVLDRQPVEMQEFLLRTSILDQLSGGLCRGVTGRTDAADLLTRLGRDNLFVTPLDDHEEWFRYHHLFGELLLAQLERREPATVSDLHRSAAAWYEANGDLERAVRHAVAGAQDLDTLADLAARACDAMHVAGQHQRAWRLLSLFDDGQFERSVVLALTASMTGMYLNEERLQRLSRHAMSMDVGEGSTPIGVTSLHAWQLMIRASRAPDGVARMREDAALAGDLQEGGLNDWADFAVRMQAMAFYLAGTVNRALVMYDRRPSSDDPNENAWWIGLRGLIAADQDDWERAVDLDRELGELPAQQVQVPPVLAHALVLGHSHGTEALSYVDTAGRDLFDSVRGVEWRLLLCADVFGEVALWAGDPLTAERWTAEAEAVLERYPDAGVLRGRTKRLRKALEERRMAEPLTAAERRVLDLLPTQLTAGQIATRLFLTENTVKSHLSHIYRKLGVTTRTDAVEAARRLGLL